MNRKVPRLRMFAGPNGSGKSTLKAVIDPALLGIYINPDEIEVGIRKQGFLDLNAYGVKTTQQEVSDFFGQSSLLKTSYLGDRIQIFRFVGDKLYFDELEASPYFAAVAADFIRNKLIEEKQSFTFETVMSHPDKVELLRKAQAQGYRTYLYYVATEDPSINVSRVNYRVKKGGHPVPEDKIISRYYNSLNLLIEAVKNTNRAYIFDNSQEIHLFLAEITDGKELRMETDQVPTWFQKALLDKLY